MSEITYDPMTWPAGDKIWNVCRAIALAEGANVEGDAPDRLNNPGDLSKGDEHGQSVLEYVILPDKEEAIHFLTKTGGWMALYKKINNIRLGNSAVYQPTMTWIEIAGKYETGSAFNWANNVASKLGVAATDRFCNYFGQMIVTDPDIAT